MNDQLFIFPCPSELSMVGTHFDDWSRGRVDGSQSDGPQFDPHVSLELSTKS